MRLLTREEKKKRGCNYCLYMEKKPYGRKGVKRGHCAFDECPFRELDNYKDYDEFFEKHVDKIKLDECFHRQSLIKKLII